MLITAQQLKETYAHLSDPMGKISRDIKSKNIFPLIKGVYGF